MGDIVYVSEGDFQAEVLKSNQPVLVDFTATWCGPCKMLEPVVKQLASQWDSRVKVVKVDVDQCQNLAMGFQVMGVPTLILFVEGKPVERTTGYQPREKLERKFQPHLGF